VEKKLNRGIAGALEIAKKTSGEEVESRGRMVGECEENEWRSA